MYNLIIKRSAYFQNPFHLIRYVDIVQGIRGTTYVNITSSLVATGMADNV